MIRLRRANIVKCSLFREFVKANEDLNSLCKEHGWATARFLVPVIGGDSEFIAEYEYPDYAAFRAENAAQMSDPEYMKIFRSTADLVYPRRARTELYQEALTRRVSSSRRVSPSRSRRSLAEADKVAEANSVDGQHVKVPSYA